MDGSLPGGGAANNLQEQQTSNTVHPRSCFSSPLPCILAYIHDCVVCLCVRCWYIFRGGGLGGIDCTFHSIWEVHFSRREVHGESHGTVGKPSERAFHACWDIWGYAAARRSCSSRSGDKVKRQCFFVRTKRSLSHTIPISLSEAHVPAQFSQTRGFFLYVQKERNGQKKSFCEVCRSGQKNSHNGQKNLWRLRREGENRYQPSGRPGEGFLDPEIKIILKYQAHASSVFFVCTRKKRLPYDIHPSLSPKLMCRPSPRK